MIKTYAFYVSGVIAGIPGTWNAGQAVDVDEDTMTVVAVRPLALAAQGAAQQNLEQPPDASPQENPRKGK